MPIKPGPFTFVCEDCHWKKTVAPRSDALLPGDGFATCPKCGDELKKAVVQVIGSMERGCRGASSFQAFHNLIA